MSQYEQWGLRLSGLTMTRNPRIGIDRFTTTLPADFYHNGGFAELVKVQGRDSGHWTLVASFHPHQGERTMTFWKAAPLIGEITCEIEQRRILPAHPQKSWVDLYFGLTPERELRAYWCPTAARRECNDSDILALLCKVWVYRSTHHTFDLYKLEV
jgi:hypothetical protein